MAKLVLTQLPTTQRNARFYDAAIDGRTFKIVINQNDNPTLAWTSQGYRRCYYVTIVSDNGKQYHRSVGKYPLQRAKDLVRQIAQRDSGRTPF